MEKADMELLKKVTLLYVEDGKALRKTISSLLEGAKLLAEKMRHKIETTDFGEAGVVTCSFGVTQFKKGEAIEEMMKRVDIALYEAKGTGKNRVVSL